MPLVDPVTMSSAIAKNTAVQAQAISSKAASAAGKDASPASQTTLHPVQTKQTPLAQTARHAFPALLSGLFVVRFRALVADPVSAMTGTLAVTTALQIAYAVVCLPAAGSSHAAGANTKAARKSKSLRPGEKKREGATAAAGPNGIATAFLSLLLTLLVTPVLYAATILFGAPLLTHTPHTFLCAAHLAVLTLLPLFYVHGVDAAAWAAVGGFAAPLDETFGGLVGGVVGAWLGAVPIPLDWDREWQRWPVTILCGLYGGYVVGRVLGGTVGWGKRF